MGGGTDGVVHIRNRDGNFYVRYLYWNGSQWDWNANWLDNHWDETNPALVRASHKFLPRNWRGSFVS